MKRPKYDDSPVTLNEFISKICAFIQSYCSGSDHITWNEVIYNQKPFIDLLFENAQKIIDNKGSLSGKIKDQVMQRYTVFQSEKSSDLWDWEFVLENDEMIWHCDLELHCGNICEDIVKAECYIEQK